MKTTNFYTTILRSKPRYSSFKTRKLARSQPGGSDYTINRFPIATALGYKWSLKAGYPEKTAQLLGYAISLAPNCVKNAWRYGMKIDNGVAVSKSAFNEEPLLGSKYINFSRWTFALNGDKITLAKLRNIQWWDNRKFEITMAKLSPNQLKELYARIDKLFENKTAQDIEYIYTHSYKIWQKWMDDLRMNL